MLIFITGSAGKFEEAKQFFPDIVQKDIDLPEIQELEPRKIIEEKLKEALKLGEREIIVEDTLLYLECMNSLPGPLIKWFLKTVGNEGLYKISEAYGNFSALAKTVVGYADKKGKFHFFEGEIKGSVVSPRGEGFGWDPIFMPEGYKETFGEMVQDEKNKISMRGVALKKLKEFLTSV